MGITGAGALQAAGAQQQNQAQKNLDLQYQDFLRQQAYPQMQNNALQGALAGVQPAVPTAKISEGTQPTTDFAPSAGGTTAQVLAALAKLFG
jgi:hypothetical protein